MLVHGRYECRHGNIERDRTAVVLRHIDGHGVAADPIAGFEQPEVEAVSVVMETPSSCQPGDSAAHNSDASQSTSSIAGCMTQRKTIEIVSVIVSLFICDFCARID